MIRALAFFLVLVLIGAFALINWDAFSALTPLSLGFTSVKAPLGLIMLGLMVFLCLLFGVWMISLQGRALMHSRRQSKELQAQRELADRAEASRLTELRVEVLARIDAASNGTAAHIAQLEDRLERAAVLAPESQRTGLPTPR
ncbi:MAG TPA: LapA family protein [Burkholderiaceae bacterium]